MNLRSSQNPRVDPAVLGEDLDLLLQEGMGPRSPHFLNEDIAGLINGPHHPTNFIHVGGKEQGQGRLGLTC